MSEGPIDCPECARTYPVAPRQGRCLSCGTSLAGAVASPEARPASGRLISRRAPDEGATPAPAREDEPPRRTTARLGVGSGRLDSDACPRCGGTEAMVYEPLEGQRGAAGLLSGGLVVVAGVLAGCLGALAFAAAVSGIGMVMNALFLEFKCLGCRRAWERTVPPELLADRSRRRTHGLLGGAALSALGVLAVFARAALLQAMTQG